MYFLGFHAALYIWERDVSWCGRNSMYKHSHILTSKKQVQFAHTSGAQKIYHPLCIAKRSSSLVTWHPRVWSGLIMSSLYRLFKRQLIMLCAVIQFFKNFVNSLEILIRGHPLEPAGWRRQGTGGGIHLPGRGFNHIHTLCEMEKLDVCVGVCKSAWHIVNAFITNTPCLIRQNTFICRIVPCMSIRELHDGVYSHL